MERPVSVNMPSMRLYPARARFLVWAVAYALASAAVLASIPFLFGSPQPIVLIHWREVSASERRSLEREFGLTEATQRNGDTWGYVPTRTSPDALHAIVTHPSVADTDGIDRRALTIADSPPLTPRRGGLLEAPAIARAARVLAYALACLASIWLLRSALVSPPLQPNSPIRRALGGQVRALTGTLTALSRVARARMQRPGWAAWTVAATGVLLFATALAWRFLTFTGFTNDHYVHVALAQQMLLGERPIRDFIDSGWPLMYLVSAGAWRVAGDTLATEWTIVAGGLALGAASTVAAGYRLSGSLAIAVLVTILEILIYPRTYAYPKVLVYAAAAWAMLALAAHPSRRRVVLMAAIVTSAFLFRHDHGLFIGVASVVCLVLASRTEDWRVAVGRAAALTSTVMVFLLPWILFVAFNGGLIAYFQVGVEYSRNEADATALASWPTLHLASPVLSMANAEAWLFWLF